MDVDFDEVLSVGAKRVLLAADQTHQLELESRGSSRGSVSGGSKHPARHETTASARHRNGVEADFSRGQGRTVSVLLHFEQHLRIIHDHCVPVGGLSRSRTVGDVEVLRVGDQAFR